MNGEMQASLFLWIVIIIYNFSTIFLLRTVLRSLSFPSMLVEKRVLNDSNSTVPTSASRVIASLGSIILATFLWGLGNVVLYKSIVATAADSGIKTLLDDIGNFFLAGASLFAPYAFNQLTSVFQSTEVKPSESASNSKIG